MSLTPQQNLSVSTTSTDLLPEAPDRVAVIISAPKTNNVTVSTEATAVAQEGVVLYSGNDPLILSAQLHGDLVHRAWTAIAEAGSETISVIEVFGAG